MSKNNIEDKLREEILLQLKKVTPANSPHVFNRIQGNYPALEQQIIETVITTGMQPSAIIPQIEMEGN